MNTSFPEACRPDYVTPAKKSRTGQPGSGASERARRKAGATGGQSSRETSVSKVDPSFKSKRYRDKLRMEIKGLEVLLPIDRTSVHRKLDSQTVFRLSIGYFRTKLFLQEAGLRPPVATNTKPEDTKVAKDAAQKPRDTKHDDVTDDVNTWENSESLLKAIEGYLLVVTSDGTILYVSENILQHLGFNQVDLVMRCMYGIVHPDDHQELKVILEQTLNMRFPGRCGQKMQCTGHMRTFPCVTKSQRTSNQVLFALCRPFLALSTDPTGASRTHGFWTKHELDMAFKQMEAKVTDVLGHEVSELEGTSFYSLLHPEDLLVFRNCHRALIRSEEIQTMYFRVQHKDKSWVWLHTRGKVVFKNSKKYSIIFTHCPVKEEDSTYIQQEAMLRHRHAIHELMYGKSPGGPADTGSGPLGSDYDSYSGSVKADDTSAAVCLHEPHGQCPSTWHTAADRHSPVFPQHHLPHQPHASAGVKRAYSDGGRQLLGDQTPGGHPLYTGQSGAYAQVPSGYGPAYNGLGWWNMCQPGAYDRAGDEYWGSGLHAQAYNAAYQGANSMRKEYYMQFNGVGFAAHDVQFKPQYPSSTLFIQGHVTAYESEARCDGGNILTDQCLTQLPHFGQVPVCCSRDCAYNCVHCKGAYPAYLSQEATANSSEEWPSLRRSQAHTDVVTCDGPPTVKQEHIISPLYPGNPSSGYVPDYRAPHTYPELVSASDIPVYTACDVTASTPQHSINYANM